MSLYRREGSPFWWYDFTVNGLRFRGSTEEESKSKARGVESDKRADAKRKPKYDGNWRLRYVFGAYWNDHAIKLASSKTVEYQLAALSAGIGRDTLAIRITSAMLITYRAKRRGHGLSEASINREMEILRAALNHARDVHKQAVPILPWLKLRGKEPPGRTRFLSFNEFDRLREAATPSLRPILDCAVTTGLRKGNILTLDWERVELDQKIIRAIVKGNKEHVVRIVPQLVAYLSSIPAKDRRGRVFDRTNFEKRWREAVKSAGLSDLRFHDLRHTFASWARQSGADIADVCEALGHSDISMTMRYAHIKPDAANTAFDRVSEALTAQSASHRPREARKAAND